MASDFQLPPFLAAALAEPDGDEEWQQWIGALPGLVAELAAEWNLVVGPPFVPGGQASWVAPARGSSGRELVLKVGWRHFEAEHEADGLRTWNGNGAVHLLETAGRGNTSALLLERCRPGTSLAERPPAEQDEVLAGLLGRLWIDPPVAGSTSHPPFRPLAEMCDDWADHSVPDPALDRGLVRAGLELFRELPRSAEYGRLLVTDLHAENVLAATREPWLMIDPKPWFGDPAYDPLQHLLSDAAGLAADPAGRADRMAGLCGLDRQRLRLWLFARCVIESGRRPGFAVPAVALAP
jgi:streptomycin 6-kinase